MNKTYILFILIVLCVTIGCSSSHKYCYVPYTICEQEILLHVSNKTMAHGSIDFLCKKDNQMRIIEFRYHINIKEKNVVCYKWEDVIVDSANIRLNTLWSTADLFREQGKGGKIESYYKCFSDDFLDMSNDEKLQLLEKLSMNKPDYMLPFAWFRHPDVTEEIMLNMGVDNSPQLNIYESSFLNSLLADSSLFDFANKKIFFLNGLSLGSKMEYFDMQKKFYNKEVNDVRNGYWYAFSKDERQLLQNYDAVILYGKIQNHRKVVKTLNKIIENK